MLSDGLANAPFQLLLHADVKLAAHHDAPRVRLSALKRIAVQASRRQTERFDHFLRRFSDQIAQTIKLLGLMGGVDGGSSRRQARGRPRLLKAGLLFLAPLVDIPYAVIERSFHDVDILVEHL